jgi:ribosomal protein S6
MNLELPSELLNDFETIVKYQNTVLIHMIAKKYKWDPKQLIKELVK